MEINLKRFIEGRENAKKGKNTEKHRPKTDVNIKREKNFNFLNKRNEKAFRAYYCTFLQRENKRARVKSS